MNWHMFKVFAVSLAGAVVVGCTTPTTRVDTQNDTGPEIAAFDYRDVQETAREMLQSLYRSGRLDRPDGNTYVMAIGKITNDTMQANVANNSSGLVGLEYKTVWLAADGDEIPTILSTWAHTSIRPRDIVALQSTAPDESAVDFRRYLKRSR